jgi:hypothetical protein
MVRVFLIIALVGALVSGAFTFLLNGKKKEALASLSQSQTELQTTKGQLSKTQGDLKTAQAGLADTQKQLDDAKATGQAAQASLADAQKKVDDLTGKVTAAEQKANEAQAAATDAKGQLGAASDAAKAAQAKADDLDKQKRQLADDLDASKKEVDRLQDVMKRSKNGDMPPGINGKIVDVNRNWNFVVLNVGEKDGVVENGELVVSRTVAGKKEVVGKVKVVSTEANTAVADIEVTTLQGQIQKGDDVLN